MSIRFDRTKALIGAEAFGKIEKSHVLVVGLGGVGGAAVEVLARSGVGKLTLVDGDSFEPTNLNRQILATEAELGMNKAAAAKKRVLAVNSKADVTEIGEFVTPSNIESILSAGCDYAVDAIDDVKNKVLLISACKAKGIPVVSALGAGNRIDCDFAVTDVFKTSGDPFARVMRRELRKIGVTELDAVCSSTPPLVRSGKPSSIAAPPLVMGAMLANFVIKGLIGV